MPFTLSNIKEDLEDIGSRFDGAPDLEFRAATKALALEKSALSYQRVPPGYRFPYGHTHMKQEEVYVSPARERADEARRRDRRAQGMGRSPGPARHVARLRGQAKGLEILVIGAPNLGEDPREDVDGQRDWWAD